MDRDGVPMSATGRSEQQRCTGTARETFDADRRPWSSISQPATGSAAVPAPCKNVSWRHGARFGKNQ